MSDANRTLAPWHLDCPWCGFSLTVFNRGGRYGAGEEAALSAMAHVREHHPRRSWQEFLLESLNPRADASESPKAGG